MNPHLSALQPYPFERLAALLAQSKAPDKKAIAWSIGEPKHAAPDFIARIINEEISGLSSYPLTVGEPALREAIANWLTKRFKLNPDSISKDKNILPCNGSREALFAFTQAAVDASKSSNSNQALVLMPNPFYQIYEGAALLAGAKPYFINVGQNLLPDFDSVSEAIWQQCQLLIICTPGNPTGAVMSSEQIKKLIKLADQFDFILASDECYSELYPREEEPPAGLLQACADMGRDDYKRCIVFHSLSKRSNLPGMRSGFVAGDADIISQFKLYRTYHGCAMSPPFQRASTAAWQDEKHVIENRELYRRKFAAVLERISPVLKVLPAQGAFYLWPETPLSDTEFTRLLFEKENITVVPGSFLSREAHGTNPGANHIRMALVASFEECVEGAERLKRFVESLS